MWDILEVPLSPFFLAPPFSLTIIQIPLNFSVRPLFSKEQLPLILESGLQYSVVFRRFTQRVSSHERVGNDAIPTYLMFVAFSSVNQTVTD